jgi:uncharacterized protein (UPF0332 family)
MNQIISLAEWKRAVSSLRSAQVLLREELYADSVSRSYYAVLHAAKAVLQIHDINAESHAAVKRLFGLHLIQTGHIESEWSEHLSEGRDERLAADYNVALSFSEQQAANEYNRAKAFLLRIQSYLLENGLTSEELKLEGIDA